MAMHPERTLYKIGQELSDELEGLEGVLEARLNGDREEVLEIIVDPAKLEAYNLSYQEIFTAVANNNRLVPGRADRYGRRAFSSKGTGFDQNRAGRVSICPLNRLAMRRSHWQTFRPCAGHSKTASNMPALTVNQPCRFRSSNGRVLIFSIR